MIRGVNSVKNIRLADIETDNTLDQQMEKVREEFAELFEAIEDRTNMQEKNEAVAA